MKQEVNRNKINIKMEIKEKRRGMEIKMKDK